MRRKKMGSEKKLEEIFIEKGEFVDSNRIKVKPPIYCGGVSLEGISKKLNSSQLYEYAEKIKREKEFLKDFNVFLVEQSKSNFGKLFGIIPPKYFNYYFNFYKI